MTTKRIAIEPAIMMGKPVIQGTRITAELILRRLAEGASEGELLGTIPTSCLKTFGRGFSLTVSNNEAQPILI
jgi:hypothetical protein